VESEAEGLELQAQELLRLPATHRNLHACKTCRSAKAGCPQGDDRVGLGMPCRFAVSGAL